MTERPFLERLSQFWANHFAVSIDKQLLAGPAGSFEREAIRPHVLGRFTDMLLAWRAIRRCCCTWTILSMGPHSQAAQPPSAVRQRKIGINENLAREIMELHTWAWAAAAPEADVTSFAEVITG